jgi:hypothetical protein
MHVESTQQQVQAVLLKVNITPKAGVSSFCSTSRILVDPGSMTDMLMQ